MAPSKRTGPPARSDCRRSKIEQSTDEPGSLAGKGEGGTPTRVQERGLLAPPYPRPRRAASRRRPPQAGRDVVSAHPRESRKGAYSPLPTLPAGGEGRSFGTPTRVQERGLLAPPYPPRRRGGT